MVETVSWKVWKNEKVIFKWCGRMKICSVGEREKTVELINKSENETFEDGWRTGESGR